MFVWSLSRTDVVEVGEPVAAVVVALHEGEARQHMVFEHDRTYGPRSGVWKRGGECGSVVAQLGRAAEGLLPGIVLVKVRPE